MPPIVSGNGGQIQATYGPYITSGFNLFKNIICYLNEKPARYFNLIRTNVERFKFDISSLNKIFYDNLNLITST